MNFLTSLWTYLLATAPYLLLGLFVAGIIKAFISIDKIKKLLGGKSIKNVLLASLIGVPMPLCSCSVIPTAVGLKKAGASNSSTSAFLISTPETGVDSISVTYGLMDLPMTIIRPIAAFITATIAGFLQMIFNENGVEKVEEKPAPTITLPGMRQMQGMVKPINQGAVKSCCAGKEPAPKKKSFFEGLVSALQYSFGRLIDDMSFWLAFGLIGGALIDYFVPASFFTNFSGLAGKFLMLAIGIPLYICASASTPLAVSMIVKGISPGTALIMLLVGPATNFSNMAVLQKYIGKKGVFLNIFAVAVVALGLSFLVDYLYVAYNWPLNFKISHAHETQGSALSVISAVVLSVLLVKGIYKEEIKPRLKTKPKQSCCH